MAERSLKVLDTNKTFFGKISNTLSKLLVPTKIGINGFVITLKRNNLLKSYENYTNLPNHIEDSKKESLLNKYEEAYSLYLEAIDKHIMDTVYKKVKAGSASEFEKTAMSDYYLITNLKNTDYNEYKYRKQKYLIELDYESLKVSDKTKILNRYNGFYLSKMDVFYKGILKNYSVSLAESTKKAESDKNKLFYNIFTTLDEYMKNIMPLKFEADKKGSYNKIKDDYDNYERFEVGKLSEKDEIEKKILLLNMSRVVFTHSLPLVAAEQCYEKLIEDSRESIINASNDKRKEEVYTLLLDILDEYDKKLLSTKIYWEDLTEREKFKTFWELYSKKESDKDKEILLIRRELSIVNSKEGKDKLVKFYKDKLVKFGVMRSIKNSAKTYLSCKKLK